MKQTQIKLFYDFYFEPGINFLQKNIQELYFSTEIKILV